MLEAHIAAAPRPILDLLAGQPDFHAPEEGLPIADVQRLIHQRMDELSLKARVLSRRIGKNDAYINQFLGRGKPRILQQDAIDALSIELDVEPWRLRSNGQGPLYVETPLDDEAAEPVAREPLPTIKLPVPPSAPAETQAQEQVAATATLEQPQTTAPATPVVAPPSPQGITTIHLYRVGATLDAPLATMAAVPQQARACRAFAVSATANAGLLRRGNIAYCVRGVPLTPGDQVVVIRKDSSDEMKDRIEGFAELVEMVGEETTLRWFDFGTGTTRPGDGAELAKIVMIDIA